MSRFPGNIIKLPNVTPTQSSAQGVWSLKDQLVYQRNNQWPFQRDPYFNYTTLLLQGNVPNTTGPQAMTQPLAYNSDASTNNFLVTPNGDVSPRPFSPYGGGNYSVFFDGSSSFLSLADNAAFNFGTGDATVEFWFNSNGTSNNYPGIISSINYATSGAASIRFDNTGYKGKVFMYINGGGDPVIASASTIPYNTWAHVALVRQGTSLKLYLNGSLDNSVTISAALGWYLSNGGMRIGRGFDVDGAGGYFPGYISNLRLVKGTAVYTSNFTPPITPLQNIPGTSLLVCQSNRFIDNSTANSGSGFAITVNGTPRVTDNSPFVSTDFTTGAGYFDGGTDYLSIASTSTALPTGTQDYSVEAWFYWGTQTASFPQIITNPATDGFQIAYDVAAGTLSIGRYGVSPVVSYTVAQTALANQWTHVVATRSGNTHRLFINGVLRANGVNAVSFAALTTQTIGSAGAGNYFVGYMSDVRSVLGSIPTAYQTSSTTNGTTIFTPPATLLPVVSGTSLLTLQTRAASQNIGFIDSSPNEFIVTKNGNTTQGTFSPFSPTGWGNYFNGSNAYLNTATSADFAFGTGNFQIEFFFFAQTTGQQRLVFFTVTDANQISMGVFNNYQVTYYDGTNTRTIGTVTAGTWNHVAVAKTSGAVTCWLNGTRTVNALTDNSNTSSNRAVYLGATNSGTNILTGYMSNVSIIKGSTTYSGASIPVPVSPLTIVSGTVLLTCQSNRFLDQTGKTITVNGSPSVQAFSPFAPATQSSPLVTGGSGYFDGVTDYLTWPGTAAGAGAFCYEFWIYSLNGFATMRAPLGTISTSSTYNNALDIRMTGTTINVSQYNVANNNFTVPALQANTWYHVVACRNASNQTTVFLNGERSSTGAATISTNFSGLTSAIGRLDPSNGGDVTGYIAGVRLIVGSTPYDPTQTNIVVPTAPPTAIPNTSLLLNFTGGGIVDATGKNNLETVLNAQVSTVQAKWGPGSMAFDGNGDYLRAPDSPNVELGSGDFTIELWVNFNSLPASSGHEATFASKWATSNSSYKFYLYNNSGTQQLYLTYSTNGTASTNLGVNWTPATGVWYHVACVRNSGNLTFYVNGTQQGTTQSISGTLFDGSAGFEVGGFQAGSVNTILNGYIDDLRITKGYARYVTGTGGNAGQMVFNGTNTLALPTGPFPIG